jgi:hypothetical protein|tara:strand:- start:5429 stop:5674 length:246 start_codon:yes stop_codon:yes gene_type:complete
MKEIQQHLIKIIRQLIKEDDDRIVNVRGGRGYGTGHPYPNKKEIKPSLGEPGPYSPENEKPIEKEYEPVKISKAFKKFKKE